MYAYNYNRQKFANLEKCDAKQKSKLSTTRSLPSKAIKRPLPVPPPAVPPPPPPPLPTQSTKSEEAVVSEQHGIDEATPSTAAAAAATIVVGSSSSSSAAQSNGERKQKKRRTKSFERLRDQSHDIELSDSDEDIAIAQKLPTIKTLDEHDASVALSPSPSEADNVISNNTTTSDEPAICVDSLTTTTNDANTFSDKNQLQLSYDEILKIEESFESDGANGILRNIVVDIHSEPTIELRIHESDSDPAIMASTSQSTFNAAKLTKEHSKLDIEQERCHSEDDAIDLNSEIKERSERLVQSDSEILSKTPLELVVECDINENVIVNGSKSSESVDLDHNHNDIVMSNEHDKINSSPSAEKSSKSQKIHDDEMKSVQNRERSPEIQSRRRSSNSSRLNCDSGDTDSNEPDYATVDTALNMVSV